ncbi:CD83 antigen isoform X2 [Hippopotamus amphibius kiboko]|uniref:CD83 antigen isoform X2 n=1 Tax=Hippopotamus amphibius kiboko TaxID=575201 RepID=UPI0025969B80|nr:CD83 antigen isoform X2 [Hippopotamus amphibius kiboko]
MMYTDNARRPGAKYDGLAGYLGKPSLMITEAGEGRGPGFTVMSPSAAGRSAERLILSEPGFASAERTSQPRLARLPALYGGVSGTVSGCARGLPSLGRACSLAPAAREVKAACSEDVDLPCTAPRDPQVSYAVFWAKLTEGGAERVEMPQEDLQYSQQRGSSEALRERLYSLRIQNTTSCNSGTYRCTLVGLEGQKNLSGTVVLKVTGCFKGRREETFKKYRAEIVLLLCLVIFYLTLIIFTCFARQQSIFPDFSKPAIEHAFLPVTSPNKHLEPVTLHKTEVV